ncbi:MAG TPA: class D sortase [Bryobacteraceae bacterium]|nr:class D sortase [Bryobacteraceae bacterium]
MLSRRRQDPQGANDRRRRGIGRLLSYLLIVAGAVLLFFGGRDLWESRWGQSGAAKDLESPVPVPQPGTRTPNESFALGAAVAKLTIPRLDAQLYVVEGVDQADLRRGPGHMPGTALPGENGNCVVAGHRDTHFRLLKDIRKGDDIVLETRTGLFLYRVKSMQIVTPQNIAAIQPSTDAVLHLITCYPFYYVGSAPKRYIVEADLAAALDASLPPS